MKQLPKIGNIDWLLDRVDEFTPDQQIQLRMIFDRCHKYVALYEILQILYLTTDNTYTKNAVKNALDLMSPQTKDKEKEK